MRRFGIIDLGTNSCRFDVYEMTGVQIRRIHREKKMIRLGDGVFRTGRISPKAVERGLRAFDSMRSTMRRLQVPSVVAFGTSALRSAENAKTFVEAVKRQTGIPIRIISGVEEGHLIAKGILANTKLQKGLHALVDIGGGSTEVALCSGRRVVKQYSFHLGANRLQQMFFHEIPPVHKRGKLHPVLALRQHIREVLLPLSLRVEQRPVKVSIGSSGTIRTVSRILKRIGRGNDYIERIELAALNAEMATMTRRQLMKLPGLEPKRVDLILAGAILLEETMFALKIRRMSVTDYSLRDGILLEALESFKILA